MAKDFKTIYDRYTALKEDNERHQPLWKTISQYVGINVNPDYQKSTNEGDKSRQMDEFIDDPTASISVNQFGDYLIGIMWGTGENAFKLVPSRYVLELASKEEVEPYYDFASDQTLYHMNHNEAGLNSALRPYAYDQAAFGTSGIGAFPNKDFINRISDNALVFRQYGVDNLCIDEGKNGLIDHIFATYCWRVNRIVGEFCMTDGKVDKAKIEKLPREIKMAYSKNDLNQEFRIVFGIFPRADFNPKLKGKRGMRYRGVWFMEKSSATNAIFGEEDFAEKAIAVARMIKVRGDVYGRSSGTMLISTIRAVNFMLATAIEIIEKMANPSLGIFNNAIFGDSALDSSPNGLTVFNSAMANGENPAFQLYDVGDPAALVKLIIPYLNEKITTAFKIDSLLDFSSAKDMTATESLQRYAIRGKSLAGILQQQKVECLEPLTKRCVSVLYLLGQLGANPRTETARIQKLQAINKTERIIPDAVLQVIDSGRPWYEVKFNNELEKLSRTEAVQALVQIINAITAIAALFPNIVEGVDWYKLLEDINNNLDANNQILIGATKFKERIATLAQQQRAVMAAQVGEVGSNINKNVATANKQNAEARNVAAQ